jgi:hypothetical protein
MTRRRGREGGGEALETLLCVPTAVGRSLVTVGHRFFRFYFIYI